MSSIPETSPSSPLKVLIIGGGLSGLTVAHELTTRLQQSKWHLVESQNYLGGRIKNDDLTNRVDMGGAWIWPSQQHMHGLVRDFGLTTIHQEEENDGRVRISGGAARIINELADRLDGGRVSLDVEPLEQIIYTEHVVWTGPPRMSVPPFVRWDPPLKEPKMKAQRQSTTWMASVTKVTFLYQRKHWDARWLMEMKQGLYFYRGGGVRLFDLYDACIQEDDNIFAFTVFALVDWKAYENDDKIANQVMEHLRSTASSKRMMNLSTNQSTLWMKQYTSYATQHWPKVSSISDNLHPTSMGSHPHPNRALSEPEWKSETGMDMVYFAGTECDIHSPGLMEGAVGSAYHVLEALGVSLSL